MLSLVKLVEIEIHSFCNRKCLWCPNKFIERSKDKIVMPITIYEKVLYDLKDNNFRGTISYSRYNEPLSDIKLLKSFTKLAKTILQDTKLVCNTNGDYLSKENLNNLYIDELSIMDYDCKGFDFYNKKLIDIGCEIVCFDEVFIKAKFNNINILCYLNWPKHHKIEDRGGSLKNDIFFKDHKINWKNNKNIRINNCLEPTKFIGIDYNGFVVPCCHIRSDNNDHKKYILGNIYNNKLSEIYTSDKSCRFRNIMANGDYKLYCNACKYCQKEPGRYTRDNDGIEY